MDRVVGWGWVGRWEVLGWWDGDRGLGTVRCSGLVGRGVRVGGLVGRVGGIGG